MSPAGPPMYAAFILLARVLGCPCCGPSWYGRFAVRTYKAMGWPVPPELHGWDLQDNAGSGGSSR